MDTMHGSMMDTMHESMMDTMHTLQCLFASPRIHQIHKIIPMVTKTTKATASVQNHLQGRINNPQQSTIQ